MATVLEEIVARIRAQRHDFFTFREEAKKRAGIDSNFDPLLPVDWHALDQIGANIEALKKKAAEVFGAERGWRLSRKAFGLKTLQRGAVWCPTSRDPHERHVRDYAWPRSQFHLDDHADFYRWPNQRAAAMVSHLYDGEAAHEEIIAWAATNALRVEALPKALSWYLPGGTTPYIFTRDPRATQ